MSEKKYKSAILFNNPSNCPYCNKASLDLITRYPIDKDGKILGESTSVLYCVICHRKYKAYENLDDSNDIVYSIDNSSREKIIQNKIKSTKDKKSIYNRINPFYECDIQEKGTL